MKSSLAYPLQIFALILIFHVQIYSQNIGIGTTSPTAKIHIKSTIQSVITLDLDFESGSIKENNTSGDYNWTITNTDGYNSAQSALAPILPIENQVATLMYSFNLALGKEVTVSFDYKNIDPNDKVQFIINSDHFSFTPPMTEGWNSYSTTFISQSKNDVIYFSVKANQPEANPTLQIDNVLITYLDGHTLRIEDGNQMDGYYLRSDDLGYGEWHDLATEIDQKINENNQDLNFDPVQNEMSITGGNSVYISGLKNDADNTLRLSGDQIIASTDMSLYLPSSDSQSSSFHFDAENNTMDWGISTEPTKGNHSTRWGKDNSATTAYTTVWGLENTCSGISSTAWGNENITSGWRSTIWGISNEATEYESTSFGKNNISSGVLSTSWGENTTASGKRSTSFGNGNTSSGINSTSWGFTNSVSGLGATSWGVSNIVTSDYGTTWGYSNNVASARGTAWGSNNVITSSAFAATSCGYSNHSEGYYSFVGGYDNIVNSYGEVAFGTFNNSPTGNINSWVPTDMLFSLGNGTSVSNRKNAVSVLKNGNVGIGIEAPTYDLHLLANSAAKPGSSAWTVSSDRRLKKDITAFTDGLDVVKAIDPVWFTYNGLADIPEGTYVGTIAQELEEIAPYMVTEFIQRDKNGNSQNYKAVDYGAMDFVLINAIKEQQAEIEDLKAQNAELKAQYSNLTAQISGILSHLESGNSMNSISDED